MKLTTCGDLAALIADRDHNQPIMWHAADGDHRLVMLTATAHDQYENGVIITVQLG